MKIVADGIRLSATDVANHVACRHLTALDLAVAQDRLRLPETVAWLPAALGRSIAEHGPGDAASSAALRSLLMNKAPNLEAGSAWHLPGERSLDRAKRLAVSLHDSVLPIQGPPGSGKTYTAAHIACALVRADRRVGITG